MTAIAEHFADVDVSAWIGPYPFRDVPHPDPDVLVRVLEREGVTQAWVGWLPSAWHRDPAPGNANLRRALAAHADTLLAAPCIRPDWPGWHQALLHELEQGAACIRAYPAQWGYGAGSTALLELAHACSAARTPLHLTVRVEDLRQRHPFDTAGDLTPAAVRAIARARTGCTLVVSGAGKDFIEEVWWGLTPEERAPLRFDFGWVWGPPEDHFEHLVRTIGPAALVVGTQWPLRLVQQSRALHALLPAPLRQTLRFTNNA